MLSPREDGLHPIIKPRGKRAGGGAARTGGRGTRAGRAAPIASAVSDEDEEIPTVRPAARAKGKASGGKRQSKATRA